jgi:hypothetical protein
VGAEGAAFAEATAGETGEGVEAAGFFIKAAPERARTTKAVEAIMDKRCMIRLFDVKNSDPLSSGGEVKRVD